MVQWKPSLDLSIKPETEVEFGKRVDRLVVSKLPKVKAATSSLRLVLKGSLSEVKGEGAFIVEAFIRGGLPIPLSTGLLAMGPISDSKSEAKLLDKGLVDLRYALKSLLKLCDGDIQMWRRALDSAEPDEQIFAARLLANAKQAVAVEPIAALLSDPRPQVAEAAADALGEIGDERAVPLLINSIKHGDLRSEVRAIEAMSRIGGKEAKAYLEMTANGHEIDQVRKLSAAALSRIR